MTIFSAFWFNFFNAVLVYLILSWAGKIYVQSELLRAGNEELLNNLTEGVFIMDEQSKSVLFHNKAASRMNTDLN